MEKDKNLKRNRAAEKGEGSDPALRDEDGSQPGANTMSSSANDEANQHLTKIASDNFKEEVSSEKADKRFDD